MNAPLFFASAGDERGTPQKFFDELNTEFHFDLDAAATKMNAKCELFMGPGGIEEDALTADWGGEGSTVWLNPPYSIADKFIAKAREEANKGAAVVMLLPVRSDTKYWHEYIWDKFANRYVIEHEKFTGGKYVDGDWRPGVRGRFLPGRLGFTLDVPANLRQWIKDEWAAFKTGFTDVDLAAATAAWMVSMRQVTGLPKMALERILLDTPDDGLLDAAPFPSCVVIFTKP